MISQHPAKFGGRKNCISKYNVLPVVQKRCCEKEREEKKKRQSQGFLHHTQTHKVKKIKTVDCKA